MKEKYVYLLNIAHEVKEHINKINFGTSRAYATSLAQSMDEPIIAELLLAINRFCTMPGETELKAAKLKIKEVIKLIETRLEKIKRGEEYREENNTVNNTRPGV